MQRLEVSCEVRHIYMYMSLGAKELSWKEGQIVAWKVGKRRDVPEDFNLKLLAFFSSQLVLISVIFLWLRTNWTNVYYKTISSNNYSKISNYNFKCHKFKWLSIVKKPREIMVK